MVCVNVHSVRRCAVYVVLATAVTAAVKPLLKSALYRLRVSRARQRVDKKTAREEHDDLLLKHARWADFMDAVKGVLVCSTCVVNVLMLRWATMQPCCYVHMKIPTSCQ
jgi:hypothetical protein